MFKKFLFCILSILIFLIPSQQDSNAKTWERHNATVQADSILAAIDRGDSIIIDSCEIFGPLKKAGEPGRPDTISSVIQFRRSSFKDIVCFRDCYFSSSVSCSGITFSTNTYFPWSTFGEDADFRGVTFCEDAHFMGATFKKVVYFESATVNRIASFASTTFGGYACFDSVTFATFASFFRAWFSEFASFWNASFNGFCDFSEAKFKKKVDLRFKELKNFYIKWKQLEGHLSYSTPHFLLEFISYFEEQRQLDDADGVYLFLKNQERMRKFWLWRYLEYWFIQQTCGYGVKPLLPLRAGLIVVALFAIPYYWIKIREPKWALGAGLKRIRIKAWNAFYFSVNTFVSGAPIEWTPEDTRSSKKHYLFGILTTAERIFGWILLVLFVVTLTRKFIR